MEKAGVVGVVSMRVVQQPTADHLHAERLLGRPAPFRALGAARLGAAPATGAGAGSFASAPVIQTDTLVSVETLIFDLSQDKLIWVATRRTTNPSNVQGLVRDLSRASASQLRRQGLIQR